MANRLLIVDDEPDLLDVMQEYLVDKGFLVTTSQSGPEALDILASESFDLLLSDINMPGMKGFELLDQARRRHPELKTALITAYDVRDYLRMAREFDVGNIITKTTPFNFAEVERLIRNLLTEDVFGLDKYITGHLASGSLDTTQNIDTMIQTIVEQLPEGEHRRKYRQALGEIIVNAIYYGVKGERGDRKEDWALDVTLSPGEEIALSWGHDAEKTGVAVRDPGGKLTKSEILYWLERNSTRGNDGLSLGLYDDHGRGIFITRETVDRVIINIRRGRMTEIVLLNYYSGVYQGFRPLWIHEF